MKSIKLFLLTAIITMFAWPVAAQNPNDDGLIVFQTESGGAIYAVNPDGSGLRYLTHGIDPALSPNGNWVAFTRWDDTQTGATGGLWLIRSDGRDEHLLLGQIKQPKSPTWSTDGSQIVIAMQQGGWLNPKQECGHARPPMYAEDIDAHIDFMSGTVTYCYTLPPNPWWGLRQVEVETGAFTDLPRDTHSMSPTWNPAADWHVVYDGDLGLVNMDIHRNVTWPLTHNVNDHSPAINADGEAIAVSYRQHDHWAIHTLNMDGSGRVNLTPTPLTATVAQSINGKAIQGWNNVAPTWSPDDSQIAFLSDRNGEWEIWLMAADGRNPHPLFTDGNPAGIEFNYQSVDERVLTWQ